MLNEKGLPPESVRISVSWKEGDSAFHETLANTAEQPARRETPGARGNFSLRTTMREHATSQELTQTLYEIITDKLSSHGAS